ncbi:MAG: hypothetical protein HN348_35350, partial [Proteobacteria bacterium]|nr:hypothetical protein [Pseudomonadota bacterium]
MRLWSALMLLVPSIGWAAPMQLLHQGRMLDSTGVPLQGVYDVTVTIYDAPTAGTDLWQETVATKFDNGTYSVLLGADVASNPIDDTDFDGSLRYLQLALNGVDAPDRFPIVSVPYAMNANHAQTATDLSGGVVNASEIKIDGSTVIDSNGVFWGTDTLMGLGCLEDEIPVFNGYVWTCGAAGSDWSDLTNIPADIEDGDDDWLADLGACQAGELLVWNNTNGWECGEDQVLSDGEVLATVSGAPIDLAAGSTIAGVPIGETYGDAEVFAYLAANQVDLELTSTIGGIGISTLS